MIFSMTGFGRSQTVVEGLDLSIEINSVNRRNLEFSLSIPREWQSLEREVQEILRKRLHRGKIHVNVQAVPSESERGLHWDPAGLESSLRRLEAAAAEQGIAWLPGADALVRLAALNRVEAIVPPAEAMRPAVLGELERALASLMVMREAEGEALADDLRDRFQLLGDLLGQIRELATETVPQYREMLFQRLQQAGLDLDLSDERVLKEIALFADKCDISEETTRLLSHFDQLAECLGSGSPVGRKLEFILQEVNREFNTIGAKANNIDINRLVIEAKNELERVREQIQNIE